MTIKNNNNMNNTLSIRNKHLYIEGCDTVELAARFGTPLFVLSETHLRNNLRAYQRAFQDHWPEGEVRVMPAIKANPTIAVRRILTEEGAGCDVFGPGELECALRGGVPPDRDRLTPPPLHQAQIVMPAGEALSWPSHNRLSLF